MKRTPVVTSGGEVHITVDNETNKIFVSQIESQYRFASQFRRCCSNLVNSINVLKELDYLKLQSYVVSSVILSYSFLEAALNEFISINVVNSDVATEIKGKFKLILDENLIQKEKKNILQVFNLYLRILGKNEISESNKIYQSANIVRVLRNLLVHPVPGKVITYSLDDKINLSGTPPKS